MPAHGFRGRGIFFVTLNLLLSHSIWAATYTESVSGDLSNSQSAPTALLLSGGANSIVGTVGGAEHQDFIKLTIPSGFEMSNFVNASYSGSDAQGFTGFQFGSTMVGSTGAPGTYAGYAHFGSGATNPGVNANAATTTVGVNLLPSPYMAQNGVGGSAEGASGFTLPLAAGDYTFLIQQSGSQISYSFTINLSATPEPASVSLLAIAGSSMLIRRRR